MKILFVCTGNLCRSPMAEAMLRQELEAAGVSGVEVSSAGTWAPEGSPVTRDAALTLAEVGIDVSRHRSRSLERRDVEDADLVVVMTSVHVAEVLDLVPGAAAKVRLLKELPEIAFDAGVPGGPAARLTKYLDAPRPERRRSLDVDDPIGLGNGAYARCRQDLAEGISVLVGLLGARTGG
jgi:protein-tyrosine-phosphatase